MASVHAHHYDPNESFQSMADAGYLSPRSPFLHHQYNEGRRDSLASTQSCAGLSFASSNDYSSPEGALSGPPTSVHSPIPQERLVEVMSYEGALHGIPLLEHHRTSTPACGTEELYNNFAMATHAMSMHSGTLTYTSVGSTGLSSPAQNPPLMHEMDHIDMHTSRPAWIPTAVNAWPPSAYHPIEEQEHPSTSWATFQPMTPSPQETIAPGSRAEVYMVPPGFATSPSPSQGSFPDDEMTLRDLKSSSSPGPSCHPARRLARTQRRPSRQPRKLPTRSKITKTFLTGQGIMVKTEEKSLFSCQWPGCIKSFKRLEHSKRHYLSHKGIVVAKCPLCPKHFGRNDNFIAHMKTHLPQQKRNKGKNVHHSLGRIIWSLGDNTKVIEKVCAAMGVNPEEVVLEPPKSEESDKDLIVDDVLDNEARDGEMTMRARL